MIMDGFKIGDVVQSVAGRDKNGYFLVVGSIDGYILIADGKTHKVKSPKRKNPKHLIKVIGASSIEGADGIQRGEPFGNERLKKAVKRAIQK